MLRIQLTIVFNFAHTKTSFIYVKTITQCFVLFSYKDSLLSLQSDPHGMEMVRGDPVISVDEVVVPTDTVSQEPAAPVPVVACEASTPDVVDSVIYQFFILKT